MKDKKDMDWKSEEEDLEMAQALDDFFDAAFKKWEDGGEQMLENIFKNGKAEHEDTTKIFQTGNLDMT